MSGKENKWKTPDGEKFGQRLEEIFGRSELYRTNMQNDMDGWAAEREGLNDYGKELDEKENKQLYKEEDLRYREALLKTESEKLAKREQDISVELEPQKRELVEKEEDVRRREAYVKLKEQQVKEADMEVTQLRADKAKYEQAAALNEALKKRAGDLDEREEHIKRKEVDYVTQHHPVAKKEEPAQVMPAKEKPVTSAKPTPDNTELENLLNDLTSEKRAPPAKAEEKGPYSEMIRLNDGEETKYRTLLKGAGYTEGNDKDYMIRETGLGIKSLISHKPEITALIEKGRKKAIAEAETDKPEFKEVAVGEQGYNYRVEKEPAFKKYYKGEDPKGRVVLRIPQDEYDGFAEKWNSIKPKPVPKAKKAK